MTDSERIASVLAVVLATLPGLVIGWETLVAPHESRYWPVLVPLASLTLLAIITAPARRRSGIWPVIQMVLFYLSLGIGVAAVVGVLAMGIYEFNKKPPEEPGLLMMVLTASFVPACLYTCFVLLIDQRKLRGRLGHLWKLVAVLGATPLLLISACLATELIG